MEATSYQIEQFARQHLQKFKVRGREAEFCCVVHEDRNPSGSLNLDSGLWLCHGCQEKGNIFQLAMAALHCDFKEAAAAVLGPNFFPSAFAANSQTPKKPSEIVAVYPYTDDLGKLLFEKVRLEPKSFYIRRPDGQGGYVNGLGDTRRVLFNLPLVSRAGPDEIILLVEGERDAEAAAALGYVATCNPFGAREWQRAYSLSLRGKRVLIIPDNDEEGRAHAGAIQDDLRGLAGPARVAILPGSGKDLCDWIEAGGTPEQLREWVDQQFGKRDHLPASDAVTAREPPEETKPKFPTVPIEAWCPLATDYYEAVRHSTSASAAYHLAIFYGAVGTILGRSVYFTLPKPKYPNFYIALVGRAGKAKKGTAIDYGQELIQDVAPDVPWLSSVDSAEGFVEFLTSNQKRTNRKDIVALLCFSELRSLIEKANKQGSGNIIPKLSEAYDCGKRIEIGTRTNPLLAENIFVSLFGGASPTWLDKLTMSDLEGGLGSRFLWIPSNPLKPYDDPPPADQIKWNALVSKLGNIRSYWKEDEGTKFPFTPEAKKLWTPFFDKLWKLTGDDPLIEILAERLDLHCRKIALIIAALDKADPPAIHTRHLKPAMAFTEFLLESLYAIFSDFGLSETIKEQKLITEQVRNAGEEGIRKRDLQKKLWRMDAETFSRRLRWMTGDEGTLQEEKRGRSVYVFLNELGPE